MSYSVKVIIRSAREQTEDFCLELAYDFQKIIGSKEPIGIIRESPFTKALRVGFEEGLKANKDWTMFIDADVLIYPALVKDLMDQAMSQPDKVFEVQGKIFDKFFDRPRDGGIHLYRTKFLPELIKMIPAPNDANPPLRPEKYVMETFEKSGYVQKFLPILTGIHDYGQFPFDIFRKAFFHSFKNKVHAEELFHVWNRQKDLDEDYKIALAAFNLGLKKSVVPIADRNILTMDEFYHEMPQYAQKPLQLTQNNFFLDQIRQRVAFPKNRLFLNGRFFCIFEALLLGEIRSAWCFSKTWVKQKFAYSFFLKNWIK
jgi:hypothetical protein